jgi:Cu(I)/Ag(I) efflux system membrane fusion protein
VKLKPGTVAIIVAAFLLGAAIPSLLIWNPIGWSWADGLTGSRNKSGAPSARPKDERKVKYWRAPMDPNYISDKPGKSPMGMDLIPVYDDEDKGGEASGSPAAEQGEQANNQRKIRYWRAPMDPNYISDKPGKSPMGMDLIPVYEDEASSGTGVRVDPSFVQNFAVRTAVVERGSIPVDSRTVGILDYNQKNIASINTKFAGWIEKVNVNYIGQEVKRGEVLFEIYSPQLVTTQQEYLAAADYVKKLSEGGDPDAVARARSLLESTRERLHYWDITEEQIDQLASSGRITRTLKMVSPVSGIVVSKVSDSLEGTNVTAGMNIYRIADLYTIWAQIDVFEYQVRYLRLGLTAGITIDAFPGRRWNGKIIYLDPAVNQQTRTLKAFVQIPNPDLQLRPQMYANVVIHVPAVTNVLRVPEEAVLHTGEKNIVIVRKGTDVFEPRDVEIGATGGGYQQVVRGLSAGDVIVTSSQFLIDSESNLKEAISTMLTAKKDKPAQEETPLSTQR